MPESALGRWADRLAAGGVPGAVALAEVPLLAKIGLRGDPREARFRDGVRSALELDLALDPNTFTRRDPLRCLWLGPDEWLVVGPPGAAAELSARLVAALQGQHAALVDLTAAYTALELSGARAREVLAKACSLDLHPRAFRPGQCAQSNFARTQAILMLEAGALEAGALEAGAPEARALEHEVQEGGALGAGALENGAPVFRLFVRRSLALYLADWLLDAMQEYSSRAQQPIR